MANVIDFTKFKAEQEQKHFDEMTDSMDEVDDMSASFALDALSDILGVMNDLGFDVYDDPKCVLDILATMESIRAIFYRIRGIHHPFHTISNGMFEPTDDVVVDHEQVLSNFIKSLYK